MGVPSNALIAPLMARSFIYTTSLGSITSSSHDDTLLKDTTASSCSSLMSVDGLDLSNREVFPSSIPRIWKSDQLNVSNHFSISGSRFAQDQTFLSEYSAQLFVQALLIWDLKLLPKTDQQHPFPVLQSILPTSSAFFHAFHCYWKAFLSGSYHLCLMKLKHLSLWHFACFLPNL